MIKKNWKTLLIASIVMLLPVLVGVILWDQLPEQMPSHWDAAGEIDGWTSKPLAVFGLPALMLAIYWVCVIGTSADPKKDNHSGKVVQLILWIVPILSVVMHTATYAAALGKAVRMEMIMPIILGLIFTIIGNYLPKCRQNYTIGIKIPWTLNSEENWNKTHRFAGRLWVVCGLGIMVTGFLGGFWYAMTLTLLMVLAPVLYSYLLHRRGI